MSSHYKQIDGKKYSALKFADGLVAGNDGRISAEDATKLFDNYKRWSIL